MPLEFSREQSEAEQIAAETAWPRYHCTSFCVDQPARLRGISFSAPS
jgi:hypothetical protein